MLNFKLFCITPRKREFDGEVTDLDHQSVALENGLFLFMEELDVMFSEHLHDKSLQKIVHQFQLTLTPRVEVSKKMQMSQL